MRTRILCVLALVALGTVVASQRGGQAQLSDRADDEVVAPLNRRATDFLREVAKDDAEEGLRTLLTGSPLARDSSRVGLINDSIRREIPKYGIFLGAELLTAERIGKALVRITCLYHCENYPVVWNFVFYRAVEDGEWVVISLQYNVDYDQLPAGAPQRTAGAP